MPLPGSEKDYQFHGMTLSCCSHCLAVVPAKILVRNGAVYLCKRCPEHGEHQEILEEDAGWYLARTAYDKPGTATSAETTIRKGCPHDCGLCPDHEQHTCIGLLEVTGHCNLSCPVCFAGAPGGPPLDMDTIARMLDLFVTAEGGAAEILQISGGEPTTHPHILDIIRLARAKGIKYVMLNTNGVRIAREPAFAAALGEFEGGFEIYLQFDGFTRRTHEFFRGQDLTSLKAQAIANLQAHHVPMTLVATVEKGVNDQEIGAIVTHGIRTPFVRGVNFQPVAYFGRHPVPASMDRLTLSGVLRRIEQQTTGMLRRDDFIPLPCDVDRVAVTYLYRKGAEFTPITRHLKTDKYLPLVKNTLAFYPEDILQRLAGNLFDGAQVCACLQFLKDALPLAPMGAKAILAKDKINFGTDNAFRITVTAFNDRYNCDLKALKKECVHVLTPDLRRIPFSAYNLFYRTHDGADTRTTPATAE